MKKIFSIFTSVSFLVMSVIGVATFALPTLALADTINVNFENPPYVLGSISGQDGWSNAVSPSVDQAVVANTFGYSGFGSQSLRVSNAYTDGAFGNWIFAKPLTDSVGETAATAGTFSVGAKQPHFEEEFDIAVASTTPQPGAQISISADRGDGSRMAYLRFEDSESGINVFFDDVTSSGTMGSDVFNEYQVGTNLDRIIPHHIKLTMDTIDGPSNDVVHVSIDGVLVKTGTSWEDYYRFDSEASAEQSPRIVKTVIIQARSGGGTDTNALGYGFIIDNLSLLSGPIPTPPPSTVTVNIFKYIDGVQATAASANSSAFPMLTTFNSPNLGPATDAPFTLSPTGWGAGDAAYEASFVGSNPGADYTAHEVVGGTVVGADCSAGQPYALVGYKSGDDLASAQSSTTSLTAPSFTNLQGNKVVLVLNKICVPTPTHVSPADGSTVTTAALVKIDWNDVTDPAGGITYIYQASNSSALNPDGSFVTPVYTSSPLSVSEIPTPGTPAGTYYWHVQATDADGNVSAWSTPWKVIVDNTPPPSNLKVHILKYLDGAQATAASANNYQFPMTATWKTANLNGGVSTSGNYVLGNNHGGAVDQYGADTAPMQAPADYTTNEITNDVDATSKVLPIGATCVAGDYRLDGYKMSATSFADAATQTLLLIAPNYTALSADQYVIVYNESCPTTATLTVDKDAIGGNNTFSLVGDNNIGTFQITTVGGVGSHTFTNLPPGTYHITETTMPKGWTQTDNTCSVTLAAGDNTVCTVTNTSNKLLGEIRGTKYEDRDGDGSLKDGDHHRLAGWTMYIDKNNNGVLDTGEPTAVTDSHGVYHFLSLPAGTYVIREVQQSGWAPTYPSTTQANDFWTVTLAAGQIAKNKNFGNFKLGSISGMKFNDINGNGKRDLPSDVGLAGWTINLSGPNGFASTTVTDANGNYFFGPLKAGIYTLSEVMQTGWHQTAHPQKIKVQSGTVSTNDNFGNTQKVIVGHGKGGDGDQDTGHNPGNQS